MSIETPDPAGTLRQLNLIRAIAVVDALFLVVLLVGVASGSESIAPILGPIHGVGFLLLVFLCVKGAGEQRWRWWFPLIVVITLGPPGSLIGDRKVRRELEAGGATTT